MESRWTSLLDSGQASLSRFGAPASRGRSGRGEVRGETPRPRPAIIDDDRSRDSDERESGPAV